MTWPLNIFGAFVESRKKLLLASSCLPVNLLVPIHTLLWYFILTYLLTPWSRVLLEKLTGSAASQETPRLFGTRRFLTVPTSARHLSLSRANSIQSPQLPPTSWRSILILSSHLRLDLPNGLLILLQLCREDSNCVNIGHKYQALYCQLVLLLREAPLGKNIASISAQDRTIASKGHLLSRVRMDR